MTPRESFLSLLTSNILFRGFHSFLLVLLFLVYFLRGAHIWEEECHDEDNEAQHAHEHWQIEWECSCQISGECIVTPLDNRGLWLLIEECESKSPVFNDESEDSKPLWHSKFIAIGSLIIILRGPLDFFSLHYDLVIWLKHGELHLDVVSVEGMPLSFCLLLKCDIKLYMVFNLVVFRIWSTFIILKSCTWAYLVTFLIMSQTSGS